MSLAALAAMVIASPLDDLALLWLAGKITRQATPSIRVADGIRSSALSGDSVMAAKSTPVVSSDAAEIDRIVSALVASRGTKSVGVSLSDFLSDKVADSGKGLATIGAGFSAAAENAGLAYQSARDRQTRRTAASILAAARAA